MALNWTRAGCLTVARTTGWVQTVGRCFARAGCRSGSVRNSLTVVNRNDSVARCSERVASKTGLAARDFWMEENRSGSAPERYVPRGGLMDCIRGGQTCSVPCRKVILAENSGRRNGRASSGGEACWGRSSRVSTGGCC